MRRMISIKYSEEFKDLLLKEKKKRGLSYAEIAEKTGVSDSLAHHSINSGSAGFGTIKRISKLLGLSEELEKDILSPKPGEEDTVGQRIKRLRLSLGLSKGEIYKDLGISPATLQKIEDDDNCFSYKRAIQFSDYFGVSLDYLLRGEEIDG